jgi:ABC-type phosphate transport system substrate-binding protein
MARCLRAEINVQGGDSGTGLAQVLQGGADIAAPELHLITFNGVEPSVTDITAGAYPIWSYGHLCTRGEPHGLTAAFLTWLRGTEVQQTLVPQLGYIPISQIHVTKTP